MNVLLVLPNEESAFTMLRVSLEALGHQVRCYFYRSIAAPSLAWSARLKRWITPDDPVANMNGDLLRDILGDTPDLVFINKGEMIFPETIRAIRRVTKVVAWYVDSPLWFNSSSHYIANSLRYLDVAFVFDGYYIPEMARWGCTRTAVLSFGCEPTIHRKVQLPEDEHEYYSSDICFIGNYHGVASDRESILTHLASYNLKIWGDGWQHSPIVQLRQKWMGKSLSIADLAKAYAGAKLSLNVTYPHSITEPNMRTFEAPACNTLLLNDNLPGLTRFFTPGQEIEVYTSIEDLIRKVDYYLAHPEEASRIAAAGQRRAHRDHTYQIRMTEMLSAVFD
jgi:spore maturation protein CgeB